MFKKEDFTFKIDAELGTVPGLAFCRNPYCEHRNSEVDALFDDLYEYAPSAHKEYDYQLTCEVECFDVFIDDERFDDALELANMIAAADNDDYTAAECELETTAEDAKRAKLRAGIMAMTDEEVDQIEQRMCELSEDIYDD